MSVMRIQDLERARDEVVNAGSRGPSDDAVRNFLKACRMLKVRDSRMVVEYGAQVLKRSGSMPQEELWLVREQVAMAALDVGDMPLATSCVRIISREFPDSMRAQRLQGMYFEAAGNWERAADVYRAMLAKDPASEMALKRQVALAKARGTPQAAIDAAVAYLDIYCNSAEGWEELAELYLATCHYKMAAHCYEELLLLNPTSFAYALRYAETLATMGGAQNHKTARAYYSMALQLSGGGCLPALLGLCASTAKLKEAAGSASGKKAAAAAAAEEPDEHGLAALAAKSVVARYEKECPAKLPLIKKLLAAQGLL